MGKKYYVYVNKYRPNLFGSADFYVGCADSIKQAKELIKKSTRNADSYVVSRKGSGYYKSENQVCKGVVYGSGINKICKDGYTCKF